MDGQCEQFWNSRGAKRVKFGKKLSQDGRQFWTFPVIIFSLSLPNLHPHKSRRTLKKVIGCICQSSAANGLVMPKKGSGAEHSLSP
eukprot:1160123-Pelagomonas_calceolata.AAC.1